MFKDSYYIHQKASIDVFFDTRALTSEGPSLFIRLGNNYNIGINSEYFPPVAEATLNINTVNMLRTSARQAEN